MRTILYFTALLLVTYGSNAMAIEEPEYEILLTTKHYEIRRYESYIVAEVDVEGDMGSAGNKAFRILAGYIFGKNDPGEKMAMTAPVESQAKAGGEKMAMTAPVLSRHTAVRPIRLHVCFRHGREVHARYAAAPVDPRIRITVKHPRTVAVRRYSGRWSEGNYRKHESALLEALETDRVQMTGDPMLARYNGPFTPWFVRRNEIQIEVAWEVSANK